MNQEYIFTLKYKLPSHEVDMDELIERLYAANCDDALIGIGIPGRIALEFAREADNAKNAIQSAHQDVLKTIPEAQLIEAAPDYVGVTDIADIVNVSRQQIRKLYQSNLDNFPAPIHEGSSAIWHLADVFEWFMAHQKYNIEPALYDVAKQTAKLNSARVTDKRVSRTLTSSEYNFNFTVIAECLSSAQLLFSGTQSYCQLAEAS